MKSIIVSLGNIDNRARHSAPAIVVFPHAGGSPRFYAHWAKTLPHHQLWGVTYPGRDARLGDAPPATLQALACECAAYLDLLLDNAMPALLVGHSMGAWVAWETVRCLEKMTPDRSIMTVVSGQNPPDCPPGTCLHRQDDAALIADMKRQNPAHHALWAIPELRQLFLPTVREDYRLLETYRAESGTVADLTVVYGKDDNEIDRATIQRWRHASHGRYRTRRLPGGHFYLAAPDTSLPHYLSELLSC
ncbi:thioesterase [Buttiauxella warmboldiae]|uniref:Thioesterase n=1 Tax=Buttiauxella warmboldiae TaxID=82993 RepID=A0A3N5E1J3_9ENTR|nr:alpha/beta fold hydrolase [Buttiauxella warmboldiae]RPH24126.1 thioesterase [Buttiauxella warmboldiae]